jgi:S-adenosylmethionine synthetase
MHETVDQLDQRLRGGLAEGEYLAAEPPLLSELQDRTEVAVARSESDDVGVIEGADDVSGDPHVPIAVEHHPPLRIGAMHADAAAPHAVAEGAEAGDEAVNARFPFAFDDVGGGGLQPATAQRDVEQRRVIEVPPRSVAGGVEEILGIDEERDALAGLLTDASGRLGAGRSDGVTHRCSVAAREPRAGGAARMARRATKSPWGGRVLKLVTAESVTEGHPDKLADRISDGVLDAILAHDPQARVAAETLLTTGLVLVAGEITCRGYVDLQAIVRDTIREVGYVDSAYGIAADHSAVLIAITEQSPDIALGVDRAAAADPIDRLGAGDQGMMMGYACDETAEAMPLPITLAHALTRRLAQVRREGILPFLRPDGKAQVTVAYDGDRPVAVDTVVVSAQHHPDVDMDQLRAQVREQVIAAAIPAALLSDETKYFINPTGRFVIGGPQGDVGLTGRKIIVDTYGGAAPHGGGAFSGKDPTKVDRSASYYARAMAKHVVAAGLARRCLVQIAYAIGVAKPVGTYVDTFGTGVVPDAVIDRALGQVFDARPAAIIEQLDLRRPIYTPTSAYGHFGRPEFPWERLDRIDLMRRAAGV